MSSIWKNNVLSFIDNYVKQDTEPKDKRTIQSPDHYWKVLAKRENKFISTNDFSLSLETIFPEELLIFTESQKQELDEFANWINSPEEFAVYLQLLAKVLSDYENAGDLANPIAQTVLKTYDYLKLKLKAKYPAIYTQYQKRIANIKQKTEEIQNRPPCPNCRSNDVKKWSKWRFRCNTCGRTFTKKRE